MGVPDRGGPLAGVRIIDLTTVVMGPFTTRILADYGADVVKVEGKDGDIMRWTGPWRHPGMGAVFLHLNRGKRSIVLDLKSAGGRAAVLALCATADVLIHNIRPAAMRRLGLDYPEVARANPKIVYVDLVGYGQRGPYAARPAYDDLIEGASGLASLFEGTGNDAPRYVPLNVADRIAGINAVHVVLAALFYRERTGKGQSVELPMFETLVDVVLGDHLGGHSFEPPIAGFGYGRLLTPLRRPHRTADGYICVLLYSDDQWKRFFAITGRADEYASNERLSNGILRRNHYHEAYTLVAGILATRTSEEWLRVLQENDIPAMPLHTMESLLRDEHLAAIDFFSVREHPTEGALRTMALPTTWSASQPGMPPLAPNLGEHTEEILREAGLDAAAIAKLRP